MNMLGQLLHSINPSRRGVTRQPTLIESVTEESHTRNLLFPDANTLYHLEGQPYPLSNGSTIGAITPGNGYDGTQGEIDLEHSRDIRIIIAQDESGPMPRTVLFDSKPGPPRSESPTRTNPRARLFGGAGGSNTAGPAFGGTHARRSSLTSETTTPRSPTVGAFQRARTRGSSISSMPNIDEHSQGRTKESVDLVNICLDCMFGNTAMSYRGPSNKLHIVPLDSRAADPGITSPSLHDGTSSFGRAEGRKKSHLAKSYTPSNPPPELPRSVSEMVEIPSREPRRRTILITRTFSVTLPDEDQPLDSVNIHTPTPQNSLGKGNGFPFPQTGAGGAPARTAQRPAKPRKTPMYAITIIIQLPVASPFSARPPSRPGHPGQKMGSQTTAPTHGHDSLGSSFDSDRRAGWALVDSNFGVDSLLSTSLSSDVDDRVDVIGQHWDVITRTLTNLQSVTHERILAHFKAAEVGSPPIIQQPRVQPVRSSSRDPPLQLQPRRALRLQSNALAFDRDIKKATDLAGERVVRGMKVPRVITGQGRWGVWREEARWLGRWAGGRDQNFFFFNLLTAFLGNHTEWLNILGPKWYRKRHREQQKSSIGEDLTISSRTIIVSTDKMAARRLIFLLAAFLPSSSHTMYDGASPIRPSTSASFRAYSQSPPLNVPISRQQSLRRTINRRGKQSYSNMRLQPPGTKGNSLSTLESADDKPDIGVADPPEAIRHSRHPSETRSIRTSLVIPSMTDSATISKSSAATTSTVTPENAVPVAHFTVPRTNSSGPTTEYRPGSSESLASANLMHTLQRSSSGHISSPSTDSQSASRWGSFMSFWSNGGRRESSTDQSDILQSTDDGLGITGMGFKRPADHPSRSALEQMVHELEVDPEIYGDDLEIFDLSAIKTADSPPEQRALGSSGVPASAARAIPERPKPLDSPLKLSVNENDGVIDVDIPLPGFGSPLQSPLLGGYHSVSSLEGSSFDQSSVFSLPHRETEQPVNVAGWLGKFHADFVLQGVTPYGDLERDIKRAMSAEPTPITAATTPTLEQGPIEKWIEVCSALVADTRTFTVKRIRLRRLVKLIPTPSQPGVTPGISGPARSQYGNPYTQSNLTPTLPMTELHLEETFIEEPIMDMDGTLVDAVERVLAQSGQPSRVQSASSSRSSSRRGRRDRRSVSDATPGPEIPRSECKQLVLGALEQVVKSVAAERASQDHKGTDTDSIRERKSKNANKPTADSTLKEGIRRWLTEVEETH